ncbi:hypothetical protein ACHAWF_014719 [Thalassiosira exigua]
MNDSAIRLWGSMAITSSKGEGTGDRAVGVGSNSRRQFQLALSTASALAVAFLLKEVHSSTMATPKYQTTTCLSGVCKASLNLKNQIFLRHNMSCIRAIRTTPAWAAGPPWLGWKSTSRRKISNIFGSKPNDHQVLYKRKLCSRTRQATLHALAQDDLEQSEQRQIESSTSARTSTVGPAPKQDAHHWFTELLPEGWCVGIHTSHDGASEMSRNGADAMVDASMLHPDEYQWGQEHYLSDNSRLSYYLGRMALRSALKTLLQTKNGDETTDQSITGDATQISFNAQIYSQIEATAIRKDYYGRPILPEIVGGSISHKKGYAVGLAQFRSSTWDSPNGIDKGLELDAGSVQWREECPIIDGNECVDMDNRGSPESSMASPVRGIGIDLEHANDDRGNRIEKRVLTSSEQKELGGLEVSARMIHLFSMQKRKFTICLL